MLLVGAKIMAATNVSLAEKTVPVARIAQHARVVLLCTTKHVPVGGRFLLSAVIPPALVLLLTRIASRLPVVK